MRRTLFSSDLERRRFLGHIVRGVVDVLREEQGLADEDCYHAFARLLSRIKTNYQLAELLRTEGYSEWVDAVAQFTVASCSKPTWSSNSLHYVLGLWSRLVASVPYVKLEASGSSTGGAPPATTPDILLDKYVPQIVAAYVRGRVDSLVGADVETALAELDDLDALEDQLDQLPGICRFAYEAVTASIIAIMDPLQARYSEGLAYLRSLPPGANAESVLAAIRVTECQLAWLVAIIGSIISGAGQSSAAGGYYLPTAVSAAGGASGNGVVGTDEATCDADLCRRVLLLMSQAEMRVSSAAAGASAAAAASSPLVRMMRVDPRLELAFVYFMSSFRRAYINEQSGMPAGTQSDSAATASRVAAAAGMLSPAASTPVQQNGTVASGSTPSVNASLAEQYAGATGRHKVFLQVFMRMGLGDHFVVVTTLLQKAASNLRFWVDREDIIRRTLDVLHDLVFSYTSGRMLLGLETVSTLLVKHTPEYFPFLATPAHSRHRTTFYTTLGRLVFMEEDSEVRGICC